jgi:hypothetical protein
MPQTPKQHFDEDINRARAILNHARSLPAASNSEHVLRDDLLRSAWMFSVGAMDAYFCDAYSDLVARVLRAKSIQSSITLPTHFENIRLPIGAILSPYSMKENWRWRMAARQLMERDTVLSLQEVKRLFNPFFRDKHKFWDGSIVDSWIATPRAPYRIFGIYQTTYRKLTGKAKGDAQKKARSQLDERYKEILQRRHDCIHNCDRPKTKLQKIGKPDTVQKVIDDVHFLVAQCDQYIDAEFKVYLLGIGCSPTTMNKVG